MFLCIPMCVRACVPTCMCTHVGACGGVLPPSLSLVPVSHLSPPTLLQAKEEEERKRMHDALMAAAFKSEGNGVPEGVGPLSDGASQETRSAAFDKLLESEHEYLNDLRLLLTKYLLPGSSAASEAMPTSPSAYASLVSRLEQILHVNEDVFTQLEALNKKQPNNQMIGLICLQLAAYLKIYIQYCADEMYALDTVREAFAQLPPESPLRSLVEGLDGRNLRSLLKRPVDRACQYPDYILQILECTPVEHPDRLQMRAGYVVVKRASADIDTKRRRAENQLKIINLQQSLIQPKKVCSIRVCVCVCVLRPPGDDFR
jgi:RhoGEF domain